jgi:DNA repair exonuclease SbcCD ATPase subunit
VSDKKTGGSLTEVTGNVTESTEKVERIREIIFGAQIREYAQKFDAIQRENTRLTREIERLNEQLREQEKAFKKQLRDEVERLTTQLHEQDQRQAMQLAELGKQQALDLQELDQKQSARAQSLDTLLHSSERELLRKLGELSNQLNHVKVDRTTLGQLLVDLGSSLNANAPSPLTAEIDPLDRLSAEIGVLDPIHEELG